MTRCEHCVLADCSACQPPRQTGGFFTSALNAACKPTNKPSPSPSDMEERHVDWWDCAPIKREVIHEL